MIAVLFGVTAWVAATVLLGGVSLWVYRNDIRSLSRGLHTFRLKGRLNQIEWALKETNTQHFEQEIRKLYPLLEKCGLRIPLIDPVRIGHSEYDTTWHSFHITFLKVLHRWIRNDEVDISQWKVDVDRENAKRKRVADIHLSARNKQ